MQCLNFELVSIYTHLVSGGLPMDSSFHRKMHSDTSHYKYYHAYFTTVIQIPFYIRVPLKQLTMDFALLGLVPLLLRPGAAADLLFPCLHKRCPEYLLGAQGHGVGASILTLQKPVQAQQFFHLTRCLTSEVHHTSWEPLCYCAVDRLYC